MKNEEKTKQIIKNIEKKDFCIGCGFCAIVPASNIPMGFNQSGFIRPRISKDSDLSHISEICPLINTQQETNAELWGTNISVHFGYSNDENIRNNASSGGILTSLAVFMLDNHYADGVIQTCSKANTQDNISTLSITKQDIINSMGSRYAPAFSSGAIQRILSDDKKYVFVGKPCEIRALNNYLKCFPRYKSKFVLKLSFFCGGSPSRNATIRLAKSLGMLDNETITHVSYRGNGWPGLTTIQLSSGRVLSTTYSNSWGNFLGRDIQTYCRFCLDSQGEYSDISCADGWYLVDSKPSFSENKGRNIIFCHSRTGRDILEEANKKGYVSLFDVDDYQHYLDLCQYSQRERKITLEPKIKAFKMLNKKVPNYNKKVLCSFTKYATNKQKRKMFLGTIYRFTIRKYVKKIQKWVQK
jgi:coenzyme F420 hydrogenase subunit beta